MMNRHDPAGALDASRRVGWAKAYAAEDRVEHLQIINDTLRDGLDHLANLVMQRRYKDAAHFARIVKKGRLRGD